jgi:hypothetical protein
VGCAGVEAAVPASVQVRLLRNSQDSLEEEVVRFLVVSAPPLQQTRLRHRFQTPLVLTEILHLIAILLTLVVAEVVDLFVVLDANFLVAIQLIWISLPSSILRRHVVSQIDVRIDILRTMQI